MKTTVQFNNVSKQYRLGLTRMNLPNLVSEKVNQFLKREQKQSTNENKFWALKDVSFELKRGESLALVGANGAGKTTILKLLANITKPTSGSISVDGKISALIELGAGFHPDLTGRENVYLNGTILGLSRKQITSRFDDIVAFADLARFIDTPVKRYSSGMLVRLGFAVASSIEPDILLVDEVLAVGDAAFQQKCMAQIRSLITNGTSIIFVSHNIYLIQAICSHAVYLERGQVKQIGNTAQIIDLYEQDLHEKRDFKFEVPEDENTSERLEITKVEVLGVQSESGIFASKQPAQIQIHYNAYQIIGKVRVSVFIKRSDGVTCCMMRTSLDNFDLFLNRGQGIVSLGLEPLQLITGSYYVEAWFLDESDSMTIIPKAGHSDWFKVKGSVLSNTVNSGFFEPNARWGHQLPVSTALADGSEA